MASIEKQNNLDDHTHEKDIQGDSTAQSPSADTRGGLRSLLKKAFTTDFQIGKGGSKNSGRKLLYGTLAGIAASVGAVVGGAYVVQNAQGKAEVRRGTEDLLERLEEQPGVARITFPSGPEGTETGAAESPRVTVTDEHGNLVLGEDGQPLLVESSQADGSGNMAISGQVKYGGNTIEYHLHKCSGECGVSASMSGDFSAGRWRTVGTDFFLLTPGNGNEGFVKGVSEEEAIEMMRFGGTGRPTQDQLIQAATRYFDARKRHPNIRESCEECSQEADELMQLIVRYMGYAIAEKEGWQTEQVTSTQGQNEDLLASGHGG